MSIKSITISAEGIVYGEVRLSMGKDMVLRFTKEYTLVDAEGEPVPVLQAHDSISGGVEWENVPTEIQSALGAINEYINSEIAKLEGLSG